MMGDGGNTTDPTGSPDGAADTVSPAAEKPNPPADQNPESWQRTTIKILIGYLSIHLFVVAFLALYPIASPPTPEGFWGPVYKDILQWDWQKSATWIVAPLSAAMSAASLWRAEMATERRWLIRICIAGALFSALFYVVLIWMSGGVYLWSDAEYPDSETFKELSSKFSQRNCAVFGAALFGALGVKVPNWFGARAA